VNYDININIDMDRRCVECGKPGACDSGICMDCATKVMGNKPLKSATANEIRSRLRRRRGLSPFTLAAFVTGKESTVRRGKL